MPSNFRDYMSYGMYDKCCECGIAIAPDEAFTDEYGSRYCYDCWYEYNA